MLANWITLSRFPILPIALLLLQVGSPAGRLLGVALLVVGLLLDTVDGIVARRRQETSLFGSVLDIAADRMYELVLWIWFAGLGLVPLALPLIIIARTTLTDAFRSIGVAQGIAPFAQHQTPLGRFLVGSAWTRIGYAVSKLLAFAGLAVVEATGTPGVIRTMAEFLSWAAVGLCVLRGLPVIVHSVRHYWFPRPTGAAPCAPHSSQSLQSP